VLHKEQLNHAMVGQDLVYANLTGNDIDRQAKNIVDAMSGQRETSDLCGFTWDLRRGTRQNSVNGIVARREQT
jgi:hypothetical protein